MKRFKALSAAQKILFLLLVFAFLFMVLYGTYDLLQGKGEDAEEIGRLQEMCKDKVYEREEGNGNREAILFTQFGDFFHGKITENGTYLEREWLTFSFSAKNKLELTTGANDYQSKMTGSHEIKDKGAEKLIFDGKEYDLTENFSEWLNIAYDQSSDVWANPLPEGKKDGEK